MTEQQRISMKNLIPDLLPVDHVSLNTKRIRFIRGQGVVVYDKNFSVEIYMPYSAGDSPTFFGVHRHNGQIEELKDYYRKPLVLSYSDPRTTSIMKRYFDEAVFQYLPLGKTDNTIHMNPKNNHEVHEAFHIYLKENLSGAA